MAREAIIANIATIVVKDLLMDEKTRVSSKWNATQVAVNCFPWIASNEDDEPFSFFMRQQKCLKRTDSANKNTKQKTVTRFDSVEDLSNEQHVTNIYLLNKYDTVQFESFLHVSKSAFLKVFQSLHDMFEVNFFTKILPETVFSLAMWKLTTDDHFEEVARIFEIPLLKCQQIIRRFWSIVSDRYEAFIKWPNSVGSQYDTLQTFKIHPQLKCFRQLFGIISIKSLDVFFEIEDVYVPIIVQIVCNAQLEIIDCFVELAEDYSFDKSPIGQTLDWNSRTMPLGSYLIGNECFPLKYYLIRPVEFECFRKDAAFNLLLQPALQLAENAFDMMAARFNTLYALEARDLSEVRQIVETICALHNLCLEHHDNYLERSKHCIIKSKWSSSVHITNFRGSERDTKGLTRRNELIDCLISSEIEI